MAERRHLSIGEVLSLVQDDFPDVTISKIRFLESQGLINPERTPSGYRKFHDDDLERLRWILVQQRDHFLPLKVIKERLASGDLTSGAADGVLPLPSAPRGLSATSGVNAPIPSTQDVDAGVEDPDSSTMEASASTAVAPSSRTRPAGSAAVRRGHPTDVGPRAEAAGGSPSPSTDHQPTSETIELTAEELAERSGLDLRSVRELEQYGLIESRPFGQVAYFDEEALVVARLAAGFARYGIEARHLRMYKVAAEREAGMFEQLITPLLKQRRSAAREQAVDMLEELAELADDLRASMVRSALREYLHRA